MKQSYYEIIEDKNFLNSEQKNFLEKSFKGPFYLHKESVPGDELSHLQHVIVKRFEHKQNEEQLIKSDYYDFFISVLDSFLQNNSSKLNLSNTTNIDILRCSINLIYSQKDNMGVIHRDHDNIKYNQLIVYLNDCDPSAKTLIYENDWKTIKKEITPEKFKGLFFRDFPHAAIYPSYGYRMICVITFKMD